MLLKLVHIRLFNNCGSGSSFCLVSHLCLLTKACEVSFRFSLVSGQSLILRLSFIFGISLILLLGGCRLILLSLCCSLRLINKSLDSIQLKNKCGHLSLKVVQARLHCQVSTSDESKVGAGLLHELVDVTFQGVKVVTDYTKATLSSCWGAVT